MKLTIEISEELSNYLAHHSVERVINETQRVLQHPTKLDRMHTFLELRDIKPFVTELWLAAQNAHWTTDNN